MTTSRRIESVSLSASDDETITMLIATDEGDIEQFTASKDLMSSVRWMIDNLVERSDDDE